MSVIDVEHNELIDRIDVGESTEHLVVSPGGKRFYIGSLPAQSLMVFDLNQNQVVKRLEVGGEFHQIAIVQESKTMYRNALFQGEIAPENSQEGIPLNPPDLQATPAWIGWRILTCTARRHDKSGDSQR